jgi:hypothetical protein
MKKKIFLEGKRGWAAHEHRGTLPRFGRAWRGTFTFKEKRSTDLSRETSGRACEGAE